MTIKSKIIEIELENNLKKKDILEKIDSPRDMIKKVNDLINNLEQNIWVIKDPKQLVKQEFKSVRKTSTPNGTTYYIFNDNIAYYSNGTPRVEEI